MKYEPLNFTFIYHNLLATKSRLRLAIWGVFCLLSLLIVSNVYAVFSLFLQPEAPLIETAQNPPIALAQLPNIANFHLFGLYAGSLDAGDLPESLANLSLVGIFNAIPESASQAVIAVPGGPQKIYKIGDEIPGHAKIYRILKDSVVINREGHLEVIALPKSASIFGELPKALSYNDN